MFKPRKPRGFHHSYIYYDERKEKLAKMEEKVKRDLGMLPEKEINPEEIRGKFVEATTHLKRRKEGGRKQFKSGVIIILIIVLLYLWNYFATGSWTFSLF